MQHFPSGHFGNRSQYGSGQHQYGSGQQRSRSQIAMVQRGKTGPPQIGTTIYEREEAEYDIEWRSNHLTYYQTKIIENKKLVTKELKKQ
eukprot:905253-Karenia_brevis.AAC.1